MDLLEELMKDLGLAFLRLDGSTPVRERQKLIDTFNEGQIPVFILSTKAGGLGINLTQGNKQIYIIGIIIGIIISVMFCSRPLTTH